MSTGSNPIVDENGNVDQSMSETMEKGRTKAFEAIKKKALLVTLERSMFTNFVFDTAFNDRICKKFDIADDSLIHVRKCLIHPKHMDKLMNITNDAILLLWNLTRPWDNNDFRILPMEMYDDFQQTFQKLKDDFEDVREQFKTGWPDYLKEAKASLGSAFNKDDYPDVSELDAIFVLNVVTRELNDPDDMRLNLTEQELIDLERDAGAKYADNVASVRDQVLATIGDLQKFLATQKNADLAKIVAPMASLINVVDEDGNDPALQQALMEFKDMLSGDFDDLDVEDAILSKDQRETKKYAEMSEDDMMMNPEDSDHEDEDDGLDDW